MSTLLEVLISRDIWYHPYKVNQFAINEKYNKISSQKKYYKNRINMANHTYVLYKNTVTDLKRFYPQKINQFVCTKCSASLQMQVKTVLLARYVVRMRMTL